MKKNNNELDERNKLIEERVDELKKDFVNLNDSQKKLLAYRKIIDLSNKGIPIKEALNKLKNDNIFDLRDTEEILAIIKASDFNVRYVESVLLYHSCGREKDFKELYKDSLVSYNKILENYKLLADELKLNNSLELSHLFTYMLWNGYYSVTKHHAYKLQERLMLPGMYSFDVMKGKGVCLAYAELLHNYLTACDKTSALLNCKVPTGKNKIVRYYTPNINRNIENNYISKLLNKSTMFLLKGLVKKTGNHAVTLIEDNNKIYIYDPTNLYSLNVIDKDTASVINGKGYFDIKPFTSLLFTANSDPNCLFEKLLNGNIKQAYTNNDIKISFEKVLEVINNNLSLLDDAYDNIHSELEFIDNQTDEIGGVSKALKKIREKSTNSI